MSKILSRRAMNLLATAGGSAGVALVLMNLFFGPSPSATADEYAYPSSDVYASPMPSAWSNTQPIAAPAAQVPPAQPSGTVGVATTGSPSTGNLPALDPHASNVRTYALSLAELHGLPEDAPPGTVLQLWVMWSDTATDEPKLQRLIRSATLEKIAPAIVEGAPPVAILRVATKDVPDLIWGDQYGTLSAVMRPSS